MKKNGFTLAEVLITLAIIGVVATMTLPTLITNTGEQQAKTGLKKGVNILNEAAQMHEALAGYHYASLDGANKVDNITKTSDNDGNVFNGENSLVGLLKARTKIDYSATAKNGDLTVGGSTTYSDLKTIYFVDGTALIFNESDAVATTTNTALNAADNLPEGFKVIFDTNGAKGPNQLSNCDGALAGGEDKNMAKVGEAPVFDVAKCNVKETRVIKDQFQLRLRGNTVQPYGAASSWALQQ